MILLLWPTMIFLFNNPLSRMIRSIIFIVMVLFIWCFMLCAVLCCAVLCCVIFGHAHPNLYFIFIYLFFVHQIPFFATHHFSLYIYTYTSINIFYIYCYLPFLLKNHRVLIHINFCDFWSYIFCIVVDRLLRATSWVRVGSFECQADSFLRRWREMVFSFSFNGGVTTSDSVPLLNVIYPINHRTLTMANFLTYNSFILNAGRHCSKKIIMANTFVFHCVFTWNHVDGSWEFLSNTGNDKNGKKVWKEIPNHMITI